MKTIEWNTGRQYTAEGQIIRAGLLANGRVVFADLSRGIDGMLPAGTMLTQSAVLAAYDVGAYEWCSEARQLRESK